MPQCCAVPLCANKAGGHRFPFKDKTRINQWLVAIRRDKFIPTKNSIICKKHFTPDDYELPKESMMKNPYLLLKKDAVPSKFPWNENDLDSLQRSNTRCRKRLVTDEVEKSTECIKVKKLNNPIIELMNCTELEIKSVSKKVGSQHNSSLCEVNKNSNASKAMTIKKYGPCQCCLKEDLHSFENVWHMLECLNVEVSTDRSVPQLVCSACCKFLQEARKFRDMVAASQKTLLLAAPKSEDKNLNAKAKLITVEVEFDPSSVKKDTDYVKQELKEECDDPMPESSSERDTSICLPSAVKQEDIKEEPETAFDRTSSGDECNERTGVGMEDDRRFDSDDSDNKTLMEVKEMDKKLTTRELKLMEKMTDAKLNLQIRENLSNILQNSTIIPFVTAKKSEKFECIYCDDGFTLFTELRNHVETEHNEDYTYKVQALRLLSLKRDPDLIVCADVSYIKCRLCGEQFPSIDYLVEHLINTHKETYHNLSRDPPHNILCFDMSLNRLTCLNCYRTFTHVRGLVMHMNQHYGSFLCSECGSKFLHENSYKIHLAQESKRGQKLKCSLCDATYGRKDRLTRHVKTKHPNVVK